MAAAVLAIAAGLEFPLPALAQMKPEQVEREVDPRQNPFALLGALSPETPVEGDVVEISGEVRSRVFPHIRTVVRFWIDGEKREETAYVIAPRAESIVVHEWKATPGPHTIRIEVLSPAGVRYAAWERSIAVRKK
jgi:hypothetical protein